jgi:hypothetical protein
MKRKGLARASTFPGFCVHHEAIFFDYEQKKGLQTDQHVVLQIYRTVCREITRKRIEIQSVERDLVSYEKTRDARLIALIEQKLGPKLVSEEISIKALHFKDRDPITRPAHDFLVEARVDLKTLENDHLRILERAIQDAAQVEMSPILVTIDLLIPIALAGLGVFHILDHGRRHRVLVILNIIPSNGQTLLLMYGRPQDQRYIAAYLSNWPDTNSILCMIESWMIHGTDHWFIRPSVWDAIPATRQRAILDNILDVSQNIGDYPKHSIFDDIRRAQIASCEELLARQ